MKKWIVLSAWLISSGFVSMPAYAQPSSAIKVTGMPTETRNASFRININTADAKTLDEGLIGVGPAKAKAIIAWRKQNGSFKTIAGLAAVKGMGPALVERNKDRLSLR